MAKLKGELVLGVSNEHLLEMLEFGRLAGEHLTHESPPGTDGKPSGVRPLLDNLDGAHLPLGPKPVL